MKTWWLSVVDTLRSSFWFVPTLMAGAGLLLAASALGLDAAADIRDDGPFGWLRAGDAAAVRDLVSAFLSIVITVMTVVFSATIVALQLASSQFGPRLIRTFMQNRGTQFALGAFVATCVYCLAVLGSIGRFEQSADAPHLATLGALLLAIASIGVLVYFIHHIARSIQAPEVIASVGEEIERVIARWYPREDDCAPAEGRPEPPRPAEEARQVAALRSNYVETVDTPVLVQLAEERQLLIRLRCRAGDFIVCAEPLADVWPAEAVDDRVEQAIRDAIILGVRRTPTQDVEYPIDQLVEIAVRAMSPSINDPFTAMTCIDRLSAGLCSLARCRMSDARRHDASGTLRVIERVSTFEGVVDAAFDKIRQTSREIPSVVIHLLEAIETIARQTANDSQRAALRRQADMIHRGAGEAFPEPEDRRDADERYRQALAALAKGTVGTSEATMSGDG